MNNINESRVYNDEIINKTILEIGWAKYVLDILELIQTFEYVYTPEDFCGVYGIPRGGVIPATIISHYLGLPYLSEMPDSNRKILVVEDIIDTGKTVREFKSNCSIPYKNDQLVFAAVYMYSHSDVGNTNIIYTELIRDGIDWVKFPYEVGTKYDNKE